MVERVKIGEGIRDLERDGSRSSGGTKGAAGDIAGERAKEWRKRRGEMGVIDWCELLTALLSV